MMTTDRTHDRPTPPGSERAARGIVLGFAGIAAVFLGWLALGMPGMDHGSTANGSHSSMAVTSMTPTRFATASAGASTMVINVHTKYQGEIPGTDAFVPYDQITGARDLPQNKQTRLLLYCRSGRMSQLAARRLMDEGYTNVAHLRGGTDAWEAAGYSLIDRQASAPRPQG